MEKIHPKKNYEQIIPQRILLYWPFVYLTEVKFKPKFSFTEQMGFVCEPHGFVSFLLWGTPHVLPVQFMLPNVHVLPGSTVGINQVATNKPDNFKRVDS